MVYKSHREIGLVRAPIASESSICFRLNIEKQEQVIMDEYNKGWAVRAEQEPDDEIIKSGVSPDNIRKWKVSRSVGRSFGHENRG